MGLNVRVDLLEKRAPVGETQVLSLEDVNPINFANIARSEDT